MEIKKDMKDEDVGGSIVGDDLAFKFVSQGGFDGEDATHREFISTAGVHGRWYSDTSRPYSQTKSKGITYVEMDRVINMGSFSLGLS